MFVAIRNPELTLKEQTMSNSKSLGFRRQNTGNGDTLGSTLQDTVLKMPIRYSLSSIREESKVTNPYSDYAHASLNQNRLQNTHTMVPGDKSIDSECIDSNTRVLFSNMKHDQSNKGAEMPQFSEVKNPERDGLLLDVISNDGQKQTNMSYNMIVRSNTMGTIQEQWTPKKRPYDTTSL